MKIGMRKSESNHDPDEYAWIYPEVRSVISKDLLGTEEELLYGIPKGITITHTHDRSIRNSLSIARKRTCGFHVVIDRHGMVHQTAAFNCAQRHAGSAMWNKKRPDRNHLVIALISWGIVDPAGGPMFRTWSDRMINWESVKFRDPNDRDPKSERIAFYDTASKRQIVSLLKFIAWAIEEFEIDPANICGLSECKLAKDPSPNPGGILPFSMDTLRQYFLQKEHRNAN